MKEILLNQKQIDTLIQHSESCRPSESCAMLFGTLGDQQWNVKEVFLTRNAHEDSKTSFIIAPEDLLQGYELADKKHLELVGIFHSHPISSATPSNTDKKYMKVNDGIPWIIFSGLNTDLRAFMLDEDMEEIKIKIMERHFFQ